MAAPFVTATLDDTTPDKGATMRLTVDYGDPDNGTVQHSDTLTDAGDVQCSVRFDPVKVAVTDPGMIWNEVSDNGARMVLTGPAAESGTVTITATDSLGGNKATDTVTYTVTAPPTPTPTAAAIGMSFGKFPIPTAVKSVAVLRYFFQPGEFSRSVTWANLAEPVKAYTQYGCRSFSLSFKPDGGGATAFGTPANVTKFLQSCPDDAEILTTFYHEHDGNLRDGSLTMARYTQGCTQLADLAHAQGAKFGPIHNGNVYSASRTPHWGLYPEIWSANEAPLAKCDFWGVDCYSPKYEDPARMDALWTYAKSKGLPLLVGEMASPVNDPAKQLAWATKARTWALSRTTWAMWWHSQVSATDIDWHMTDASAKAWFGI